MRSVFLREEEAKKIPLGSFLDLILRGFFFELRGDVVAITLQENTVFEEREDGLFYLKKVMLSPKEWDMVLRSLGMVFIHHPE